MQIIFDLVAFQTTKFHLGEMFPEIIRNLNRSSDDSSQTSGFKNYLIDFGVRLVVSM